MGVYTFVLDGILYLQRQNNSGQYHLFLKKRGKKYLRTVQKDIRRDLKQSIVSQKETLSSM